MSKRDTTTPGQPQVVTRYITDLIPYARNARTHSDAQVAQIAASIKEFGFNNPILTRGSSIVAGHGRLLAARKLGLAEVPTIDLAHLTETQARAYVLADNQLALNAGWDGDMLNLELLDLQAAGVDLNLLGFPDVAALLAPPGAGGLLPGADPDAVPEVPKVAVTRPGDLISLGRHRLMCGDSTRADHTEALGGGHLADMVWTDPPYGVSYVGGNHALPPEKRGGLTIENDSLDDDGLTQFLREALSLAAGACRAGASWYVAAPPGPLHQCFSTVLKELGIWRQTLNWVKSSMVLGRSDYHYKHEPIFYGWKEGAAHAWHSDRKQTTVLEFDKPARNGEHHTMKPVALVAYCIENSSAPGECVLDPFGGSGTTLIACEQLGRRALLMELDPIYCDVIVNRWEQATGQKAVRP